MTAPTQRPLVDVIIPCYNEVAVLRQTIERTVEFVAGFPTYEWRITVADNGSNDGTGALAEELAREFPQVHALLLTIKGRGLALREAWLGSPGDILCYMDVDLSTDIAHLPDLIGMVAERGCDVAVGTRLARTSKIRRSIKREITSRGYVFLIRATFPSLKITDAQCGFKALNRRAAQDLVPRIKNRMWFFDTELLILAQRHGYRVCELPVRWDEDPDTKVHILRTAWEDVKGLARMRFSRG